MLQSSPSPATVLTWIRTTLEKDEENAKEMTGRGQGFLRLQVHPLQQKGGKTRKTHLSRPMIDNEPNSRKSRPAHRPPPACNKKKQQAWQKQHKHDLAHHHSYFSPPDGPQSRPQLAAPHIAPPPCKLALPLQGIGGYVQHAGAGKAPFQTTSPWTRPDPSSSRYYITTGRKDVAHPRCPICTGLKLDGLGREEKEKNNKKGFAPSPPPWPSPTGRRPLPCLLTGLPFSRGRVCSHRSSRAASTSVWTLVAAVNTGDF